MSRLWGRLFVAPKELPRLDRRPSELGLMALEVALGELGQGETRGNNRGPRITVYRRGLDVDAPWCAAFVSWCFEEAAERLLIEMPFERSHGAKRLFRIIARAGYRVETPARGDVVLWDRGAAGSWQGHVGIVSAVEGNVFRSVEGNRGTFPSRVREYLHELGEGRLVGFARAPFLRDCQPLLVA